MYKEYPHKRVIYIHGLAQGPLLTLSQPPLHVLYRNHVCHRAHIITNAWSRNAGEAVGVFFKATCSISTCLHFLRISSCLSTQW